METNFNIFIPIFNLLFIDIDNVNESDAWIPILLHL